MSDAREISLRLTDEQRRAVLHLGDPGEGNPQVSRDMTDQLVRLGLLERLSEKHHDFTNLFYEVCELLGGAAGD